MLEETLDPRPHPDQFARRLAACSRDAGDPRAMEDWLRNWNDREGPWANLRNLQHWIDRARG
ncbi:MAG: hypothetical protein WBO04_12280 [Steroidobacteraceae bacterium]